MQYQSLTDETSLIVGENGESQLFTSSIQTNQFVSRLRKYLLILLLIQLSLCALLLMIIIRLATRNQDDNRDQAKRSFAPILISIIYYGSGLYAIYRYHTLGIYLFCWLGFLQYISLCFEIFFNTLSVLKHISQNLESKFTMYMSLIIAILSAISMILMVLTLKFSFKMNKFIKIFQRQVLDQL